MHAERRALEMVEVVRLAESSFDSEHFGTVVRHIHAYTVGNVASSVFRAVAERAARRAAAEVAAADGGADSGEMGWASSLQLLAKLAVAGITHCPVHVLKSVAASASSPGLKSLVGVVGDMCRQDTSPMPLEWHAVVQIAEACAVVGKNPITEAIITEVEGASMPAAATTTTGARTTLVSSCRAATVASGEEIVRFVYKQRLLPVWFLALGAMMREIPSPSMTVGQNTVRDVNRTVQLVALGCVDAVNIFAVFQYFSTLQRRKSSASSRAGQRKRSIDSSVLSDTTRLCASSAALHLGRWELALRMLGPGSPLDFTASQSSLLRRGKIAALGANPAFGEIARLMDNMAADPATASSSNDDKRHGRLSPPSTHSHPHQRRERNRRDKQLVALVRDRRLHEEKAFSWWLQLL
jgi:hypothetical protein